MKLSTFKHVTQSTRMEGSRNQQGMVLVVAMVMVLLMAIVGLSAIRGTGMQELMAGNMRDVHLRFQAAESGLRVAESTVAWDSPYDALPFFNGTVRGFLPDQNMTSNLPVSAWRKEHWQDPDNNAAEVSIDLQMDEAPRYVVERVSCFRACQAAEGSGQDLDSDNKYEEKQYFRSTAFYGDERAGTAIYLQSMYKY